MSDFPIVGANNYYLAYVGESTQNAVLQLTTSLGMNALRIWAFLDAAKPPGETDVCFQYWDPVNQVPAINQGSNGLQRLDRAIAKAEAAGIRLILTLVNNWSDFGGMPQYVQWFGMAADEKNNFYTDPRCLNAYQDWVRQIVLRRNSITGRFYRDEPAILAWELANEPRCEDKGGDATLRSWVEMMSGFLRGLDASHLISVGDEGDLNLYAGPNIDFATMHLYPPPDEQKDPTQYGIDRIRDHIEATRSAGKPMLLEEYGYAAVNADRDDVFNSWLQTIEELQGGGDMLWMLGLPKGPDQPYDPDPYAVTDPAALPSVRAHAQRMLNSRFGRESVLYPTPG